MDRDGIVGKSAKKSGHLAQLVAALRDIEHNTVFQAWCTSRGRDVQKRWWRHPAFLPSVLLVLTVITVGIALTTSSHRISLVARNLAMLSGVLGLLWVIPLIYTALLDIARMIGLCGINSRWDDFVEQFRTTALDDHEFLVAAFRICWPRLLLAAVCSATAFWVLNIVVNISSKVNNTSLLENLMVNGVLMVGFLSLTGGLAGVLLILLGLTLCRQVTDTTLVITSTVFWCVVMALTSILNITPSIPVPGVGWINVLWLEVSTHAARPSTYFNTSDLAEFVWVFLPLVALVLIIAATALMLAARIPRFRAALYVSWPLVMPLMTWPVYIGLVEVLRLLTVPVEFFKSGLVYLPILFASNFGMNAAAFNPFGLDVDWWGVYMRAPHLDKPGYWIGFFLLIGFQLSFIAILYHFALDSIKRWRRGED